MIVYLNILELLVVLCSLIIGSTILMINYTKIIKSKMLMSSFLFFFIACLVFIYNEFNWIVKYDGLLQNSDEYLWSICEIFSFVSITLFIIYLKDVFKKVNI